MTHRLPAVRTRDAMAAFRRAGFTLKRSGAKHFVMSDGGHNVCFSHNLKTIHPPMLSRMVEDAGLTVDEFAALLKR